MSLKLACLDISQRKAAVSRTTWPTAREWIGRFEERNGRLFAIEYEGRAIGQANYRDWQPKAWTRVGGAMARAR